MDSCDALGACPLAPRSLLAPLLTPSPSPSPLARSSPAGVPTTLRNQLDPKEDHLEPVLLPPIENPLLGVYTAAWFNVCVAVLLLRPPPHPQRTPRLRPQLRAEVFPCCPPS